LGKDLAPQKEMKLPISHLFPIADISAVLNIAKEKYVFQM